MADKRCQIKRKNNYSYDVLFPKTNGEYNIFDNSDTDLVATNCQDAITELYGRIDDGKTPLANAITTMGQTTSSSATYAQMATNILNISDDATATVGHVLAGDTFYQGGTKKTGTMPTRNPFITDLDAGESYNIPSGYHSGISKVLANSLASQTSGTAVTGDIKSGKTAWVNGTQLTGNLSPSYVQMYNAYFESISNSIAYANIPFYTGGKTIISGYVFFYGREWAIVRDGSNIKIPKFYTTTGIAIQNGFNTYTLSQLIGGSTYPVIEYEDFYRITSGSTLQVYYDVI